MDSSAVKPAVLASGGGSRQEWRAGARLLASDLAGYGVCSAAALALDWSLLILLVQAGVYYLLASTISFTAGLVLAYAGSVLFVFRGRRARTVRAEIAGFVGIGIAGLALNQVLLFFFVHGCGLEVALAKAPTAACVFTFNFLLRRALLFTAAPRTE
ncbi:MAG: GtrA family protein [Methylovirgula sp.]